MTADISHNPFDFDLFAFWLIYCSNITCVQNMFGCHGQRFILDLIDTVLVSLSVFWTISPSAWFMVL